MSMMSYVIYQITTDGRKVYFCTDESVSAYGWLSLENAKAEHLKPVRFTAKDVVDVVSEQLSHELMRSTTTICVEKETEVTE